LCAELPRTVLRLLDSQDPGVRLDAVRLIGRMGEAAKAAAPALEWRRWRDRDEEVRQAVARAYDDVVNPVEDK
jgi:HEAT repeat protein